MKGGGRSVSLSKYFLKSREWRRKWSTWFSPLIQDQNFKSHLFLISFFPENKNFIFSRKQKFIFSEKKKSFSPRKKNHFFPRKKNHFFPKTKIIFFENKISFFSQKEIHFLREKISLFQLKNHFLDNRKADGMIFGFNFDWSSIEHGRGRVFSWKKVRKNKFYFEKQKSLSWNGAGVETAASRMAQNAHNKDTRKKNLPLRLAMGRPLFHLTYRFNSGALRWMVFPRQKIEAFQIFLFSSSFPVRRATNCRHKQPASRRLVYLAERGPSPECRNVSRCTVGPHRISPAQSRSTCLPSLTWEPWIIAAWRDLPSTWTGWMWRPSAAPLTALGRLYQGAWPNGARNCCCRPFRCRICWGKFWLAQIMNMGKEIHFGEGRVWTSFNNSYHQYIYS